MGINDPLSKKEIGKNLRKYREFEGYTQEQLADLLDVERGTISKWERGENLPQGDRRTTLLRLLKTDWRSIAYYEAPQEAYEPIKPSRLKALERRIEALERSIKSSYGRIPEDILIALMNADDQTFEDVRIALHPERYAPKRGLKRNSGAGSSS